MKVNKPMVWQYCSIPKEEIYCLGYLVWSESFLITSNIDRKKVALSYSYNVLMDPALYLNCTDVFHVERIKG